MISELLDAEAMLYTYVDKDHFNAANVSDTCHSGCLSLRLLKEQASPVVDGGELEPFLGAAASTGVNYDQHKTSARQKELAQKLFRCGMTVSPDTHNI